MFDDLLFPTLPSYIAEWRAVYFEPIPGSGEKITILIILRSDDQFSIFDALHSTVIDNLYGDKALSFSGLVKLVKSNIAKNHGDCGIEGVTLGAWHKAQSSDMKGVVRQALYKSASLGSVALKSLFENSESDTENEQLDSRWSSRLKNAVTVVRPSYEKYFDLKIPVGTNVKVNCGFHNGRYSAKFNVCTTQTITRMKSNLMDLQILDSSKASDFYDLILYMPDEDDLQVSAKTLARMKENVWLLEKEISNKSNIKIFTCHSEEEGAKRILDMAS